MKAHNYLTLAFAILCMAPVISQESGKKVQMRIIENGKVIADTTFSVRENIGKSDLEMAGRMMNRGNVLVYRDHPGNFRYNFRFEKELDSIMEKEMMFAGDSAHRPVIRKFYRDTAVVFRDFADRRRIRLEQMPYPVTEREIIIDGPAPVEHVDEDYFVFRKSGPHKKQIIIRDDDGDVQTIRKRIDDETEIIIIKKDRKKIKPEKHNSRKRER